MSFEGLKSMGIGERGIARKSLNDVMRIEPSVPRHLSRTGA
jgi:hypothetical protein